MRTDTVGADNDIDAERLRTNADDAALWRRFRGVAGDDVRIGALHRLKFTPAAPTSLGLTLPQISPPDAARGRQLLAGVWRIGSDEVTLRAGQSPWSLPQPSKHFADRLHGFHWLPDLIAASPEGEAMARQLLDDWNETQGRFNGFSWRLDPLASRLWHQLVAAPVLLKGATAEAKRTRLESLWRQSRFLADSFESIQDPKTRWASAAALVATSLVLRNGQGLEDALSKLEAEVTAQILPDGGHVSRSPSRLAEALLHLITLRDGLSAGAMKIPDWFDKWLPRMGGMVAFFRLDDGGLAPFHDGDESRPALISALLSSLAPPRRFLVAPKSGFQKMEQKGLKLILDCGEAPSRPFSEASHAGALGFEFADGPARLITSCAFHADVNVNWQASVRKTSAHSTLTLAARDSGNFSINEESRLLALSGPDAISARRLEESDDIWLEAQHGGYKAAFGLLHRRRLFMAANGMRLTGEDALARPIAQAAAEERKPIAFEIRFHLHPSVTAIMSRDFIRLISDTGIEWKFKSSHEAARLERTLYLGRGRIERPEQIVLAGFADPNSDGLNPPNCIRWALLKENGA